jgi:hypothetical protein
MARRFISVALGSIVVGSLGLVACGDDSGGGSAAEFCSLKTAKAAFADLYVALDAADTLITDAKGKAPEEIADDFDVIADAFSGVVDTLPAQDAVNEAIDANDLVALQSLFNDFGTAANDLGSSAEVEAAGDALESYTTANCATASTDTTAASGAATTVPTSPDTQHAEGDDSAG